LSLLVIDRIGQLVTCDPTVGEGPLGIVRDAALVVQDGRVVAIERAGRTTVGGRTGSGPGTSSDPDAAERVIDAGGRCVIPGFVDSHTHLVFAGDRAAEFVARMAGEPYRAGGIMTTVAATRAAGEGELRALAAARRAEQLAAGITHSEIKSGYELTVEGEARLCRLAGELTDDVTFLGGHLVPAEYSGRADAYVELVCGEMLRAAAPFARWVDVFCEVGAFDVDQSRAILEAGRAAGLGLRVHGNQLGSGPGVQLACSLGAASVDHCTYLHDSDLEALAGCETVATFLPATDFATRQPYPDARRAIDAGVAVALATNTNPGSSHTTSMAFCIALAVRDLRMTFSEALLAATAGGARALRRDDIGRLAPGCRADVVVLNASSPEHLAYRPGVPLVAQTVVGGAPVAQSLVVSPQSLVGDAGPAT
jgi:imidazolonepropionase